MSVLQLPVFPLPLVLFPGVPQLLHIFEPRYRQMLADRIEGDWRFADFGPQADLHVRARRNGKGEPGPHAATVQGMREP